MEPSFDQHEIDHLVDYMNDGGWLTEFRKTEEFSALVTDYTQSDFCAILSNGTVTLITALLAF